MLEFALWPLWSALKSPLKSLLKDKFSIVGRQFKALLSSTVDDLVSSLQAEFFNTNIWRHCAKGEVSPRKEGMFSGKAISVEAFPIAVIENSTLVKNALIGKLKENVRLDALRTDAGISDVEWSSILEAYASDLTRIAMPFALRRMIRFELPLYLSNYVIDLAKLEPIRIKGAAGHHTLVILYEESSYRPVRISGAKKTWSKRGEDPYNYQLNEYDGFTAS